VEAPVPPPEEECPNICENAQEGVTLLPPECFVAIGQDANSDGSAKALGVVVEARSNGEPVALTVPPAGQRTADRFEWKVYNLDGEDITARAGTVLDEARCFQFALTGNGGYYHVEATALDNLDEKYAFGVLIK